MLVLVVVLDLPGSGPSRVEDEHGQEHEHEVHGHLSPSAASVSRISTRTRSARCGPLLVAPLRGVAQACSPLRSRVGAHQTLRVHLCRRGRRPLFSSRSSCFAMGLPEAPASIFLLVPTVRIGPSPPESKSKRELAGLHREAGASRRELRRDAERPRQGIPTQSVGTRGRELPASCRPMWLTWTRCGSPRGGEPHRAM